MSDLSVNQILSQMSQMRAQAQTRLSEPDAVQPAAQSPVRTEPVEPSGFGELLKEAIQGVNATQQTASDLRTRFEAGDRSVDLVDVMVASQKSSIGFEATLQVRNKFVEAYQAVMNMPM
ncbi:MAG: flagellar hook-basal body complex protein FliE [Halothiobacillaceae bacterium]